MSNMNTVKYTSIHKSQQNQEDKITRKKQPGHTTTLILSKIQSGNK